MFEVHKENERYFQMLSIYKVLISFVSQKLAWLPYLSSPAEKAIITTGQAVG